MLKKIDHIGLAVKNLEEAITLYEEKFGLKASPIEEMPAQKVKLAKLPIGEVNLELLQATSEDSPIAKFIAKRGEGIHHIAFQVKNLAENLQQLDQQGICLIDPEPKAGSAGKKIAFLHPKSTLGSLIELIQ